jgi:glutamyl-tRNA reductase
MVDGVFSKNIMQEMDKKNKIGFIGAGIMGQGMVQNLLKAGNEVSIIANKNRRPYRSACGIRRKRDGVII